MDLRELDFGRGLRPQRNDQIVRLSVKLRGVLVDTWEHLTATLRMNPSDPDEPARNPSELVNEAIRVRALIAWNQEKRFKVQVLAPGSDNAVDLVEYLDLSKPKREASKSASSGKPSAVATA